MLRSFLLFWLRSNLRHPWFSSIKLIGFALGIASTLLLIIFSFNELAYDRFHTNHDRLYRMLVQDESKEGITTSAVTVAAIAESLKAEIPEIEATVRFAFPFGGFLKWNDASIKSDNLFYADSSVFSVFSFALLEGNPKAVLAKPYSIVLSETLAKNLFGEVNPIGETIVLDDEKLFQVTGIVEDAPANSQIRYKALMSFNSLYDQGLYLDWNGGWNYISYFLLHTNTKPEDVVKKSIPIFNRELNDRLRDIGVSYSMSLEPIVDSHLFSEAAFDLPTKGSLDQILILSVAGLFILVMSCVNFISLSAVQATSRLKEIGIKKVIGAHSRRLFVNFMLETVLLTLTALILALFFLLSIDSNIESYIGIGIISLFKSQPIILALLIALVILMGFISGAYPALILARFRISEAVKGKFHKKGGLPAGIRALILFQFTVTIVLLVLTTVVFQQRNYIFNKNLGFRKDNIVVLPLPNQEARDREEVLSAEMINISGVLAAGASSEVPGNGLSSNGYLPEGHEEPMMINVLDINDRFLETLEIDLADGRIFKEGSAADKDAYIVNEAFVRKLGWENPIGKIVTRNGEHEIIGVVKDFHFNTLHSPVEPLIMTQKPWRGYNYLFLKISGDEIAGTIEQIRQVWNGVNTNSPFEHFFFDQTFNSYYEAERKLGEVFMAFAIIAIILCSSGLYATISYSLKNKIKEIGIRKILGADTASLASGMGKRQLIWIVLANIIALPMAGYLAGLWLDRFESSGSLVIPIWVGGFTFSLLIGILTSGAQTLKAANSNPVEIIRQE